MVLDYVIAIRLFLHTGEDSTRPGLRCCRRRRRPRRPRSSRATIRYTTNLTGMKNRQQVDRKKKRNRPKHFINKQ